MDWVGWLDGWSGERASEQERPLVKVPFTLMTKNRANRTSLNGTDEWLWKQHLICIEGASLSTLVESASSLARSLSFPRFFVRVQPSLLVRSRRGNSSSRSSPSTRRSKEHCPLSIDSIVYFIQIARRSRKTANLFMIANRRLLSPDDRAYVRAAQGEQG